MLLADCEEIAFLSEWWADLEVNPDAEFESHIEFRDLSGEEEFQFGVRRAKELFDLDSGLPAFVKPPYFLAPVATAIAPLKQQENMLNGSDGIAPRTLKTLRGIAPITKRASGPRE